MEIQVPTSMYEVPLYQMQEYTMLPDDLTLTERQIHAVSIFCGITMDEIKQIPLSVLNKTIDILAKWINEKPKFIKTFTFNGVKYGFIPNLDTMPLGEYIDIDNYSKETKDLYKVMSVLYRPITIEGQNGRYDIEAYKGNVNESFKEMPSEVAMGGMLFFWTLGIDLLNYILKFLKEAQNREQMTAIFQKNGDGWESFNSSLTEILQNLKRLAEFPLTPLSYGHLTKATLQNLNKLKLEKQQNEQ